MDDFQTPRFGLPLLAPGQAHKEVFHNEALSRLDILVHPSAQAIVDDPSSIDQPVVGQCWIIGPNPVGLWAGRAAKIAAWTSGGWQFILPVPRMRLFLIQDDGMVIYENGGWTALPDIPVPEGGSHVDVEARIAIAAILDHLKR